MKRILLGSPSTATFRPGHSMGVTPLVENYAAASHKQALMSKCFWALVPLHRDVC
jgi:hypothetical protein